ncbi:hypothetical protein D9M71_603600 [compost metagenome]
MLAQTQAFVLRLMTASERVLGQLLASAFLDQRRLFDLELSVQFVGLRLVLRF